MTRGAKQVGHAFCLDGGRLLAEYNDALRDWADRAFALIQDVRGHHDLYKQFFSECIAARTRAMEKKLAYDNHVAEHGC
jgi:hypothetical protein